MQNRSLVLRLSEKSGVESLLFEDQVIGGDEFLQPFVTYRSRRNPQRWFAQGYTLEDPTTV